MVIVDKCTLHWINIECHSPYFIGIFWKSCKFKNIQVVEHWKGHINIKCLMIYKISKKSLQNNLYILCKDFKNLLFIYFQSL